MTWRFRKSFKLIPGVRLNLSKSGLSCSIGGAPLTLNVGPRGLYGTASLPGTGVHLRQRLSGGSRTNGHHALPSNSSNLFPAPQPSVSLPAPIAVDIARVEEIRSASTELLTSESLKELKQLLQMTYQEHEDITNQLSKARSEKSRALSRFCSWNDGFVFKRIFKQKFAKRKEELESSNAKVSELEEQLKLTAVATQIDISKEQADPYFRLRDAFAGVSECAAIWDIKSHQAIDSIRERTTARTRVDRQRVAFSVGSCDLIQWEQKVPHMENANGGDMFLYPGFILYRAAREAFSVIDYHDLNGKADVVTFQEQDTIPEDAKVVGQTWAKANKDGSRDKRFQNNYQIQVVAYASFTMKTQTGLWEEFQFSNVERFKNFVEALNAFIASFESSKASQTIQ